MFSQAHHAFDTNDEGFPGICDECEKEFGTRSVAQTFGGFEQVVEREIILLKIDACEPIYLEIKQWRCDPLESSVGDITFRYRGDHAIFPRHADWLAREVMACMNFAAILRRQRRVSLFGARGDAHEFGSGCISTEQREQIQLNSKKQ